jgi:hypothetical protein
MLPKMLESDQYGMSYIEVIEEDKGKNEFIFFSKHNWVKETKKFLDKHDIIIDPPIILDKNHLLTSVITENKNVDKSISSLNFFYNGEL